MTGDAIIGSGAQALMEGLVDSGITRVFANPGTSELHLMSAIEADDRIRCTLGLFEGVCSGAADGFTRAGGETAACLLHLGPGLGNAFANLHNARRARTPMVVIVGDHGEDLIDQDPPLASNIAAVCGALTDAVRTVRSAGEAYEAARWAAAAAHENGGRLAVLIVRADAAWGEAGARRSPSRAEPCDGAEAPSGEELGAAIEALDAPGRSGVYVGGDILADERSLRRAAGLAARYDATLFCPTFPARLRRGEGVERPIRLAYAAPIAAKQLAGLDSLVCIGAPPPVPFFAHPDRPSRLLPQACRTTVVPGLGGDASRALDALIDRGSPDRAVEIPDAPPPYRPPIEGVVSECADAFARLLPAGAQVVDEAVTASDLYFAASAHSPPHDWMFLTGGAIGQGLPCAVGAAIADRTSPTICLQADGSAMYTVQALWTAARENAPLTAIVFSNRRYAVLRHELGQLSLRDGEASDPDWVRLDRPAIDWVDLSRSLGVAAQRVEDATAFADALTSAFEEDGPSVIVIES